MSVKKATYKVDNGTSYDEVMFKTTADQVFFTDGQTFQQKLDNNSLKGQQGEKGEKGEQGLQGIPGDKIKVGTDIDSATEKVVFFKVFN